MRVFVAEKPSLARTIAEALGSMSKRDGYINCGSDVVTWCFGHLLEMAPPELYNKAWGNRHDRSILPIVPDHIVLVPREDKGVLKQLELIGRLAREAAVVVNAGDPDREGQLLVDEVLDYVGYRGETQRIFLAALDPVSVARALAGLDDNARYRHWRDAADTRRTVDWLGGINLSRAMTIFGNSIGLDGVLSLGRVQTPTLRIVVDRDRLIENFVACDYAELVAEMVHAAGTFRASFKPDEDMAGLDPEGRLIDFKVAEEIQRSSAHLPGVIQKVERKKAREWAKLPYSLASLQVDAGAKLGLGAQQVLNIAQKLYEGKLTTYPRTDCEYLPEEQFQAAKGLLARLAQVQTLAEAAGGADPTLRSRAWNTEKVTAHHAIIPTGVVPEHLSSAEQAVYRLIAIRYILQFWPPLEYEATKIQVLLENNTLWEATGRLILHPGWTVIVRPDKEGEPPLPRVAARDPVHSEDVLLLKKRTTPPPHFTEGTLINAMKNIHRFVEDKAARAKLRETSGLGTEATRAGILEILKKRGYLELKGKSLLSTGKGRHVIDLCPEAMKDIATTAVLEDILSDVQKGTVSSAHAISTYVAELAPMINDVFARDVSSLPKLPFESCPVCGRAIARIISKKTKKPLWICKNPDCKALFGDLKGRPAQRIVPAQVSEIHKCPLCGKAMARRQGRDGNSFFWACTGYPDCRWTTPDADGAPLQRDHVAKPAAGTFSCPLCGHKLSYGISSKTGRAYWACFTKSPKHGRKPMFFNVNEQGEPIQSREKVQLAQERAHQAPGDAGKTLVPLCPVCGEKLKRGLSTTGRSYFSCNNTEAHGGRVAFYTVDDAGAPIFPASARRK